MSCWIPRKGGGKGKDGCGSPFSPDEANTSSEEREERSEDEMEGKDKDDAMKGTGVEMKGKGKDKDYDYEMVQVGVYGKGKVGIGIMKRPKYHTSVTEDEHCMRCDAMMIRGEPVCAICGANHPCKAC